MNISSITNTIKSFPQKLNQNVRRQNNVNSAQVPSFKGIYVQDIVDLGDVAKSNDPPMFLPKDALLLNEIANEFPHQDCFICKGYAGLPRLEYREKPPEVQLFSKTMAREYRTEINPRDPDYPSEPLLLYGDNGLNRYIGMTSYISLNPSLPFTVKVGFELHKKLIERKNKILEMVGKTDSFDLGDDTVIERAHKEIKDVENAVTRYLMEAAYAALTDRASASQIYASDYPKVQTRLDAKRKYDLITSIAKRPEFDEKRLNEVDICELAVKNYPNDDENKSRIQELANYLTEYGIVLG
jgi:hypothetical protein